MTAIHFYKFIFTVQSIQGMKLKKKDSTVSAYHFNKYSEKKIEKKKIKHKKMNYSVSLKKNCTFFGFTSHFIKPLGNNINYIY